MDKWEQLVADRMAGNQVYSAGYPYTRQFGEIFLAALRQCEADTIRRCAGMADAIAEEARTTAPWGVHNGGSHLAQFARGASASSAAILALLPQEPAQ